MGKKSTDPSRHQGERVREEGREHKEQEQEASRRRPETRPKCSDPSLLGASLTLGTTSCRPKAQSILRWHAVSMWRRGVRFGSLTFWSLALQKATAFFGCSKGTKCCRLQCFCVFASFAGTMQKRRKIANTSLFGSRDAQNTKQRKYQHV